MDDGGADSFADFVRQRQAALVRLGWALTGDRQLGEDLAQAAFDRLWKRWARVSASGDAWPYAQRIAVSLASTWRRRRWHGELSTAELPEHACGGDDIDSMLSRRQVDSWLRDLPARQRAVVVLRYLFDLSVDETADRLECSPGTVKSQTAKAFRTLRATAPRSGVPTEEGAL